MVGGRLTYLITGISGFVGGHYIEYLFKKHTHPRIVGIDINPTNFGFLERTIRGKVKFYQGTILDRELTLDVIKKTKPDYIVNLASCSSVAYSWENPVDCFVNNTNIFLNLIETVRKLGVKTKILSVGSSEEYGIVGEKDTPLTEKAPLNPTNPYAIAKLAQEELSRVYSKGYKLDIVCTRSFNHIGPRQKDIFVISSFAKQVIEAKNQKRGKIICGNLSIIKDFIDVRDVIEAYDLLLESGKTGEVYNVCSGEGHELSEILDMLQKKAGVNIPAEQDSDKVRPIDNPVIIGSSRKLNETTGFKRKYNLSQSLDDMLKYWEKEYALLAR